MNNLPFISVVIPAYNEEHYLARCLEAVTGQDYPGPYEIIVVDNGSGDKTQEIARSYPNVKVISEPKKGVGFARQAGFSVARGKIIASTDADSSAPPDWLSRISQIFYQNDHLVGITGPPYPLDAGRVEFFGYPFYKLFLSFYASRGFNVCAGFNFAILAKAFWDLGGFNTSLRVGEDSEFWKRLKDYGPTMFVPDLIVPVSCRRLHSSGLVRAYVRYSAAYIFVNLLNLPPTFLK